jgi:hypothetical protein
MDPERPIVGYDPEARINTPRLEDLSYQEVALDWIVQVLNVRTGVIDAFFMTEEGSSRMMQVRREHEEKYKESPVVDPDAKGLEILFSFDHEEHHRREEELEAQLAEVAQTDPGVMVKNRFLAFLADQMDGTNELKRLMGWAIDTAAEAGHELSEEDIGGDMKDAFCVLARFKGDHVMHMLYSLRQYAEAVGNNEGIYQLQFMGLWDIFRAGQESASSEPEN